jgi:hypothetical protein
VLQKRGVRPISVATSARGGMSHAGRVLSKRDT